jgi:hypothetical protein
VTVREDPAIAFDPTIGPKREVPEIAVPDIAPVDVTEDPAIAFDPTIGPR